MAKPSVVCCVRYLRYFVGRRLFYAIGLVWLFFVLKFFRALYFHNSQKVSLGFLVSCNLKTFSQPLWPTRYWDWTRNESKVYDPAKTDTLHQALIAFSSPLPNNPSRQVAVVTYATYGFTTMTAHFLCRAWAVDLRPIVIALDQYTCEGIANELAGRNKNKNLESGKDILFGSGALGNSKDWVCLDADHIGGSLIRRRYPENHPEYEHSRQRLLSAASWNTKAFHELMVARGQLNSKILEFGIDILFVDSDVIFVRGNPLASIPANRDLMLMRAGAGHGWDKVIDRLHFLFGFKYGNFGYVYAKSLTRTVSFFQFLFKAQIDTGIDDQPLYIYCMNNPLRWGLSSGLFSKTEFVNGYAFQNEFKEPYAVIPKAVHMTWVKGNQKISKLKSLGLWNATCTSPSGKVGVLASGNHHGYQTRKNIV